MTTNYRILSLDGGGTWALIQVKALIALYDKDTPGHSVLSDFDLVAANSGGSIVLGTLVENFKLGEILDFFQSEAKRRSVFSKATSFGERVLHDLTGLGPKYSAENKLPALEHALPVTGNIPLKDVVKGIQRAGSNESIHLLIVGFDYDRNRAKFFRSSDSNAPEWGKSDATNVTLAQAIHASTNAPLNYFDAPAVFPGGRYWDGAVTGCNNPVLAGVTEAITKGQSPGSIVALSLGTGSIALPWPQPGQAASPYLCSAADTGFVHDLTRMASSILSDPPDIASFLAHVMTGCGLSLNKPPADSRIVRMSPLISPLKKPSGEWGAPGSMTDAQFTYMTKLDMDAVDQHEVDAITKFADLWLQDIVSNQPLRMDGDTLACELGQQTFSNAVAAWKAIR